MGRHAGTVAFFVSYIIAVVIFFIVYGLPTTYYNGSYIPYYQAPTFFSSYGAMVFGIPFPIALLVGGIARAARLRNRKKQIYFWIKNAVRPLDIRDTATRLDTPVKKVKKTIYKMQSAGKIEGKLDEGQGVFILAGQAVPANVDKTAEAEAITKTRLFGMIKAFKKIDLAEAARTFQKSKDAVRNMLFEILGENKVNGHLDGDTFIIESDVNEFIEALDTSFATWDQSNVKAEVAGQAGPVASSGNISPSRCPFCSEAIKDGRCTFCSAWVCSACKKVNQAVEDKCSRCGTTRYRLLSKFNQ